MADNQPRKKFGGHNLNKLTKAPINTQNTQINRNQRNNLVPLGSSLEFLSKQRSPAPAAPRYNNSSSLRSYVSNPKYGGTNQLLRQQASSAKPKPLNTLSLRAEGGVTLQPVTASGAAANDNSHNSNHTNTNANNTAAGWGAATTKQSNRLNTTASGNDDKVIVEEEGVVDNNISNETTSEIIITQNETEIKVEQEEEKQRPKELSSPLLSSPRTTSTAGPRWADEDLTSSEEEDEQEEEVAIVHKSAIAADQVKFMKDRAREKASFLREEEEQREKERRQRANQRLKELEEKMALKHERNNLETGNSTVETSHRTLYDPSRSFSSMITGKKLGIVRPLKQQMADSSASSVTRTPEKTPRWAVSKEELVNNEEEEDTVTSSPNPNLIHLDSYEDRSRDVAGTTQSNKPRMLFDPKSGSMVEASSIQRPKSGESKQLKKEKKVKKRGERIDIPIVAARQNTDVTPKKSSDYMWRKDNVQKRKFPRTYGVLYKMGHDGRYASVDECEGDLGYGAHSVHGGKVHNPKAYAVFQKKCQINGISMHAKPRLNKRDERKRYNKYSSVSDTTTEMSQTYEDLFHTFNSSTYHASSMSKGEVKLNDTGEPESPVLQATAVPWAPSQTALVAAAASINNPTRTTTSLSDVINNDNSNNQEDDDVVEDTLEGLGFDPTANMDFMGSPALGSAVDRMMEMSLNDADDVGGDDPFSILGSTTRYLNNAAWGSTSAITEKTDRQPGQLLGLKWSSSDSRDESNTSPDGPSDSLVENHPSTFLSLSSSVNNESAWKADAFNGIGSSDGFHKG